MTLKQSQNEIGTQKIVSQLVPALKHGRDAVDAYIDLPIEQRSSVQFNHAIRLCLVYGMKAMMFCSH